MNKNELISVISKKTGKTQAETKEFIETFIETVTENLKQDEKVSLIGFGTFETRERKARQGRNPQTGKEILIPATKSPAFKAGSFLKEEIKKSK